ncbi:MAG: hypothetical protein GY742_09595 [Hyphomicrobiales bacterium]|nr:hypothetical protein [Hyphomicrobiales bacterium]
MGVSVRAACKWRKGYREPALAGLRDRSSRQQTSITGKKFPSKQDFADWRVTFNSSDQATYSADAGSTISRFRASATAKLVTFPR